jgi:transcriptional regulator EpsA
MAAANDRGSFTRRSRRPLTLRLIPSAPEDAAARADWRAEEEQYVMPVRDPAEEASDAGSAYLSTVEGEAVVRAVEAAPLVRRRHQFFVWSQGPLQVLLPHTVLVCGAYARQQRELAFDVLNSVVLPQTLLQTLTEGQGPLLRGLTAAWIAGRGEPQAIEVERLARGMTEEPARMLVQHGIVGLALHGVARPQRPSELETFFVFGGRTRFVPSTLEMMLPHLHTAWQRFVAAERDLGGSRPPGRAGAEPPATPASRGLSAREREILGWVREGKSNHDIAHLLGLSPLTVKNHVQKILRKLGAANRAQAVAQALGLGLLDDRS